MHAFRYEVVRGLAESGNRDAMWEIIRDILAIGRHSVSDGQSREALRYLERLIDGGDWGAAMTLGGLYYTGMGSIPNDYHKAMALYELAAEKSGFRDSWSLNNLAYCYYYGRTGKADYERAFYYYSLAVLRGNENAMYKLGDFYYRGQHVAQNFDAAFYWYSEAKRGLTYTYLEGGPDAPDGAQAGESYYEYLCASVAMRLGRAYLFGEGTDRDEKKARAELEDAQKRFARQAALGDPFSAEGLNKVRELLNKL